MENNKETPGVLFVSMLVISVIFLIGFIYYIVSHVLGVINLFS
jgi:hypothetical protein